MDHMKQAIADAGLDLRLCLVTGKRRHVTEGEAAREVGRIQTRGLDRMPSVPMNKWFCEHCQGWHVGHRLWNGDDMRRGHTPAGYGSNAGAVADLGKYYAQGEDVMLDQAKLNDAVQAMVAGSSDRDVFVFGAPRGTFAPWVEKHDRIEHVISSNGSAGDASYTIPVRCGVVVVTRFLSSALGKAIREDAKKKAIPYFGVYNSASAVNRALAEAFQIGPKEITAAPVEPTSLPVAVPADVVVPSTKSAVVEPTSKGLQDVQAWFAEMKQQLAGVLQAIEVCEDVALQAVRDADAARAELASLKGAADQLKVLRAALRSIDGGA